MKRVRFTPTARSDLRAIYRYVARENLRAALALVENLKSKTMFLGKYPDVGRAFPEYGEGVRGYPVGKYVLFYRLRGETIDILHVFHSARDVPSLF